MPRLTVDPSGRILRDADGPYPLIVDTAWSSFADPTPAEWRVYLETRRRQGFTAVLVSVLPILHDREERAGAREPFLLDARGHHRFDAIDPAYFAAAREYTRIAHEEYGLRLMIAVLWNNYLPGTWGAAATPRAVMTPTQRDRYLAAVIDAFAGLEPIFVVGGDDSYDVPEANAAYVAAADLLRAAVPGCLLTTHSAPRAVLPDALLDRLDFFLHQSGHNVENQELTWRQPEPYLAREPRKPLLNSEPPYEQHGKVNGTSRWSREETRSASWTSVLAGASAGIGYGAHGMWMWHATDGAFQARGPSLEPFLWPTALAFPGADDIGLLGRLHRAHGFERLDPAQHLLADDRGGDLRCGASEDRALVVVYLPYAIDVELLLPAAPERVTAWALGPRTPLTVEIETTGHGIRLRQIDAATDQVIILESALP